MIRLLFGILSSLVFVQAVHAAPVAKPTPTPDLLLEDPEEASLKAEKRPKRSAGSPTDALTLKVFLNQVRAQSETVRSSELAQKGYELKILETDQEFMPYLNGDFSRFSSRPAQQAYLNASAGEKNEGYKGTLGVSKKWSTGTQTSLSYGTQYLATYYPIVADPNNPYRSDNYWTTSTAVTLSQPLLKDFNAQLNKYGAEKINGLYTMSKLMEQFKVLQVLAQAESAYWRLSAARTITEYKADTLVRTRRLGGWSERRMRSNVGDKSDYLQAQAAMKLRTLELQLAREEQVNAARAFNSLRNVEGDGVPETLEKMTTAELDAAKAALNRTAQRLDVLAAEQDLKAKRAEAREAREKLKPDLSLYGSAALYGRDIDYQPASQQAMNTAYNAWTVGVKFTMPLDFGLISDIKQGYNSAAQAAEVASSRKNYELEQDWRELRKRFGDAISRLEVSRELEKLQQEKFEYEQVRQERGRTTTYQVLTFEEDYSNAQLNRLRIEAEVLQLRAQARLYNGEAL